MNDWIDLDALWRIVVIGLLAGAGLPAVFAVGLKALTLGHSGGEPQRGDTVTAVSRNPAGVAIAAVCFAVVLAAIGYGIYLIVAGT